MDPKKLSHILIFNRLVFLMQRPAGVIKRKRPFATWFPYTAIERLWCRLEESIHVGHMTDQCEKLKMLLHGALRSHLILVCLSSDCC